MPLLDLSQLVFKRLAHILELAPQGINSLHNKEKIENIGIWLPYLCQLHHHLELLIIHNSLLWLLLLFNYGDLGRI